MTEKLILCNYHIKTLLMWNCERREREWWESINPIAVCSVLLRELASWLAPRTISWTNAIYSTISSATYEMLPEWKNSCWLAQKTFCP